MECIFCKIVKNELPAALVFENKEIISFLDIRPVNKGHCLVLPKKHVETFLDLDTKTLHALMSVCQKVAKAMVQGTNAGGFNIILNSNNVAGGEIPHAHFHLIPRFQGDGIKNWPHKSYQEKELGQFAEKIKRFL